MIYKNSIAVAFILTGVMFVPVSAGAQEIEACLAKRLAALDIQSEATVVSAQGCRTDKPKLFSGREKCSASVCWDVPPGLVLLGASATTAVRNGGGDFDLAGPNFTYQGQDVQRVCFSVSARTKKNKQDRAEHKINVVAKTVRRPTAQEVSEIVDSCLASLVASAKLK